MPLLLRGLAVLMAPVAVLLTTGFRLRRLLLELGRERYCACYAAVGDYRSLALAAVGLCPWP